ncbi:MAG TPA: glycerol-3-phosphate dehydrogenase/oxidase, partial [Cyclobacteriaceae bacterium]|nr:glycerol-3-phosphate dehydrogenase/oxidase [Cyclobacteriaceae bacterium]
TFGKYSTALGLWIYDLLAGVPSEDKRKMLSKRRTLEIEPLLPSNTLKGSGLYAEYRTDDARLTTEIIKTAIDLGADCINYIHAEDFIYTGEKISGIVIRDKLTGKEYNIISKTVVSAAGPWVDDIRAINHSKEGKTLHLTKGVHIVVPHEKLPVKHSIYFDVPDGRMIFAIPRGRVTYIGTTDTDFFGSKDEVRTSLKDASYLIDAVNLAFPSISLTIGDIQSSWAGLRPLINQPGKKTFEISRKDEAFVSHSGLISIAGGKLTGYRKMSLKIVNLVSRLLKSEYNITSGKCRTRLIRLSGNSFKGSRGVRTYIELVSVSMKEYGLKPLMARYLVQNYGDKTDLILSLMDHHPVTDPELRLIMAELQYCIQNEMIVSGTDFMIRRTGRLYFDIDSVKKYEETILSVMAREFEWSPKRLIEERNKLEMEIYHATHFE